MKKTIVFEIPEEVLDAVKIPPDELEEEIFKELALAFYKRGILSAGNAAHLAKMTRWEFEELLGYHKIPRHYTEDDLEDDIKYGLGR